MESLIPLWDIRANPWQPRQSEDAEHIQNLAASIAKDGLMQTPVGRQVNGHVELAFGHSRWAAYKLLFEGGQESYATMPVIVRELSDAEMFNLAITENMQRRDLTPVEEAAAMERARREFGMTSEEIGRLFGLSASAVRNKIRLLELPDGAKAALAGGQLTEGAARKLLSYRDVAPAVLIDTLATDLAQRTFAKPGDVAQYIDNRVVSELHGKKLWSSWETEARRDAANEFKLDWKPESDLPVPTPAELKKFGVDAGLIKDSLALTLALRGVDISGCAKEIREAITHLMRPPACQHCPFYVIADDGHCLKPVCFTRKAQHACELELAEVSKRLGVPVYDRERDGDEYEELPMYGGRRGWFESALRERANHLRVMYVKQNWGKLPLTDSRRVELISVSEESIQRMAGARTVEERERAKDAIERQERIQQGILADKSREFLQAVAARVFGLALFDRFTDAEMNLVLNQRWTGRDDAIAALGITVCGRAADHYLLVQGPVVVAKHLQGVATTAGIKLPADWMELAERYVGGQNE